MNVADNVGYGLKIRKVPKAEIAERVKQALRLVQLEEYGNVCRISCPVARGSGLPSQEL